MQGEVPEGRVGVFDEALLAREDPPVELAPLGEGDRGRGARLPSVRLGVGDEEGVAVPEGQKAAAHLAVDGGLALALSVADVGEVQIDDRVLARIQIPHHLGAEHFGRFVEGDGVARRLVHLVAARVAHQGVAEQHAEGRLAREHRAHGEERIEPVAELTREALDHEVRREPLLEVGGVGVEVDRAEGDDARVEPRVADVGHAAHGGAAVGAGELDRVDEGTVGRVAGEHVEAAHRPLVQLLLAADDIEVLTVFALADPDRQGQPPEALLRDHPVAHVLEPVELAGLAVRREPADLRDELLDAVAPVHTDEPLVDQAEDELALAAPAVRVDVGVALLGHE